MRKLVLVLSIAVLFSGYTRLGAEESADSTANKDILYQAQKFKYILEVAEKYFADSLDIAKISEAAFAAMLDEMDGYSAYYDKDKMTSMRNSNRGEREGIGANVMQIDDTVTVYNVIEGSPADLAGVEPGDQILEIDGTPLSTVEYKNVGKMLTGELGSMINLKIQSGENVKSLSLIREKVKLSSIKASFIYENSDVGYVGLQRFSDKTEEEFLAAYEKLKKSGMKKMIIDLRGNGGGYLKEALELADKFVSADKPLAYTKAKDSAFIQSFPGTEETLNDNFPIAILTDSQTASAAEAFAGSFQDFDRGLVVGELTFGKGTAQHLWELKDSTGFRITVAKYYTASGRAIYRLKSEVSEEIEDEMELSMGSETAAKIIDIIEEDGLGEKAPIFQSKKGRPIIGGGGIFPDYFVKKDTTTRLTQVLKKRLIFLEFSIKFTKIYGDEIRESVDDDFKTYSRNFKVNDKILENFVKFSKAKGVWNEKMFETDKEQIRDFIKAVFAHTLWGNDAFNYVELKNDAVFIKAVNLLPEAEKLISEN